MTRAEPDRGSEFALTTYLHIRGLLLDGVVNAVAAQEDAKFLSAVADSMCADAPVVVGNTNVPVVAARIFGS